MDADEFPEELVVGAFLNDQFVLLGPVQAIAPFLFEPGAQFGQAGGERDQQGSLRRLGRQ